MTAIHISESFSDPHGNGVMFASPRIPATCAVPAVQSEDADVGR
jgi:hypothetical protein